METPTIVRKTKDYLLIKVPLPKPETNDSPVSRNGKMTAAEKRGWKRLREAKQDIAAGRVITAPSIKEALTRYAEQQWD